MKTRILLTLLVLIIGTSINAQNVSIPDANFKAYLVGNASINTNSDTEIQVSEATAFTGSISCASLSISDLTGVEAFTNLTVLFCVNNPLSTIDVSQNTALTTLSCANTSISSLDVSHNTALLDLSCGVNSITSLDLSNNTALTILSCPLNNITQLDVSALVAVNFVQCDNNALTYLNVANGNNTNFSIFKAEGNPNLTCITVDDVNYSTTNWTDVDTVANFNTNCPPPPCTVAIPDAIFKSFLVSDPTINTNGDTEIQCSEASAFSGPINLYNKSISDLTGIEAFVNLAHLSCVKNNLTSIDVSNNTALLTLHVNDNALTTIDVSNNLLLETFQCTDNAIANIDVTANTALTNFACSDNSLTTLDVTKNTALTEFWCMSNNLTTLDVSSNTALTYFSCYGNALTSLDMSNNTALGTIYCDNNALTSLNMANGNNANLPTGNFSATSNPDLACVQVDDMDYSTTNWTSIDSATSFSIDCSGTTSILEMEKQDVNIYPNPVQNELFIELENGQITEANILDLSGKTIKSMVNNNANSIDVSSLKQGVYILRVYTASGVSTKRFIKQ